MSGLAADKFFFDALRASADINGRVEGRIFNPARATIDEEEDRIPYIIITLDSVTNDGQTKDSDVEGDEDVATVSVLCVDTDRDRLASLTQAVRNQCRAYLAATPEADRYIYEWQFTASEVGYDPMKPCCYQTLRYQCDTINE